MSECYLGEIALFSYERIPSGWLPCDGRLLNAKDYTALFSLLGARFGGDGRTNFRLPDLRGRSPLGQGRTDTGYTYTVGSYGGAETVVLNSGNLPSHTHKVVADATNGASALPGQNYFAQVVTSAKNTDPQNLYAPPPSTSTVKTVPLNPATVSTVGAGQGHENMQPYLAMSYCIATTGFYPSHP
jgi:microcystin-dependent protein